MDPSKAPKTIENPLATVVAAQGGKLEHLTTEVESAFNVVQKEIIELQQSSAGTVVAISKLSDQLLALTAAITTNAAPPPFPPPVQLFVVNAPAGVDASLAPLPSNSFREPHIPSPKCYEGDLSLCAGFITQCELVFRHNPSRFYSDDARIAFIVSLLTGRALEWAVASFSSDPRMSSDYDKFLSEFRLVFNHPPDGADSASRLHTLCQGSRSVAEYAVEFRILAAKSRWGGEALMSAFRRGLSDSIKDLILRDRPTSLADLISLALKVDDRLRERCIEKNAKCPPGVSRTARPPSTRDFPVTVPTAGITPFPHATQETELMQLGRSRLTQSEREHRMQNKLCLYCGKSGHFIQSCTVRPKRADSLKGSLLVSHTNIPKSSVLSENRFPVTVSWADQTLSIGALLDSGADDNLIDYEFAVQSGIPLVPLTTPLSVQALNGNCLGKVTHQTQPLSLVISGNHVETICFRVLHSSSAPLVLGRPWLTQHDPHISWSSSKIRAWGEQCFKNCLRSAAAPSSPPPRVQSDPPDLSGVPAVYHDLSHVFSKESALSLPPHRPYDCSIDLLPGAPLPRGRLYNLSGPEKESMQNYISESLASGIIRPSSSPVATGFFFVGKKDGGLRPCIDYRQLNDITVKKRYPLPLLSSTFEPLSKATIFTKLDLRNAYHLVRIREGDEWKTAFNTHLGHFEYLVMPFGLTNAPAVFQSLVNDILRDKINKTAVVFLDDILVFSQTVEEHIVHVRSILQRLLENRLFVKAEKCDFHAASVEFLGHIVQEGSVRADPKKVAAVENWERPTNRTQLRRFLGFANFYRKFIRGFSQIATPLNALTSPAVPFLWSPEADDAFSRLKALFSSAPVLAMPDPTRQFVLEVDASETGIGAILSQRSCEDNRLHPCAFFSRKLSAAEQNYDVGNRELLAIHDALKEWRHWLEGATLPFVVMSDHKNLVYLQTAKRLSPRQSRWALFFTRFNFTISYKPGTENVRADALSRQFCDSSAIPAVPEPILPPSVFVGALTWEIETEVSQAHATDPGPAGGPPNCLFVPSTLRAKVLTWGHTHKLSGHPGSARTEEFIRRRFWWPGLSADVKTFVAACDICARNKNSHRPPAGLLHPLEVPTRPWSHISLDFVTGLPPSEGNDTILTIVDRFSKAVHYVPLPKLPSASEMADLLTTHVIRLHGIPTDIVSDRGPQFTSKVWQTFCKGIGATVSLTSGYHPQSNGQAERANQSMEDTLRCVCHRHPSTWSSQLAWVEYAHNTLVSSASGLSPFEASLGYQPPLFPAQEPGVAVASPSDHVQRCRLIWEKTRASLLRSRDRSSRSANRRRIPAPVYLPGQEVYLRAKNLPVPGTSKKLAPRFVGPFTIESVLNPVSVRLSLPSSMHAHPVFHVSQIKPVTVSPHTAPEPAPPPPQVLGDGDLAWEVNKVMDVRRYGRGFQYLVDWVGYQPEDRSWVPRSYFADDTALSEFYDANPSAIGRPPRVGRKGGGALLHPGWPKPRPLAFPIGPDAGVLCNPHDRFTI